MRQFIPHHEQTRKDYGFDRAGKANHWTLLYVYKTILNPEGHFQLKTRILDEWRRNGTLAKSIVSEFETRIAPGYRGKRYEWFFENHEWLLDGDAEATLAAADDKWESIIQTGWRYFGGSPLTGEEIQEFFVSANWSGEKIECMLLCGKALLDFIPNPQDALWMTLEFYTANTLESTADIVSLYYKLLNKCSFQEFLTAYYSSGLVDLFKSKDLESELAVFYPRGIKQVLSASPHRNDISSVWWLKRFILSESGDEEVMEPSIMDVYGFANCQSCDETSGLKDPYARYFRFEGADALTLERASVEGNLFDYLDSKIKLTDRKKHRKLLKKFGSESGSSNRCESESKAAGQREKALQLLLTA